MFRHTFANLSYAIKDYRRRAARDESMPVDPVELDELHIGVSRENGISKASDPAH